MSQTYDLDYDILLIMRQYWIQNAQIHHPLNNRILSKRKKCKKETLSHYVYTLTARYTLSSNELALLIRWPKYWSLSFSISPSNEYSGLVWSPCSPRDPQESSPTPQFKSTNSSVLSLLYGPTLTSIHDYWKNHSFDHTDLCWQSNISAF